MLTLIMTFKCSWCLLMSTIHPTFSLPTPSGKNNCSPGCAVLVVQSCSWLLLCLIGMAGARGWDDMMQPAILIGSLGYAIGTALGSTMGFIFRSFWFLHNGIESRLYWCHLHYYHTILKMCLRNTCFLPSDLFPTLKCCLFTISSILTSSQ